MYRNSTAAYEQIKSYRQSSLEWCDQVAAAVAAPLEPLSLASDTNDSLTGSFGSLYAASPVPLSTMLRTAQQQAQGELPSAVTDLFALMLYGEPSRPPPPPPPLAPSAAPAPCLGSMIVSQSHVKSSSTTAINRTPSRASVSLMTSTSPDDSHLFAPVVPSVPHEDPGYSSTRSSAIPMPMTREHLQILRGGGERVERPSTTLSTSLPSSGGLALMRPSSYSGTTYRLTSSPQFISPPSPQVSDSQAPEHSMQAHSQANTLKRFYRWLTINTDAFGHVERVIRAVQLLSLEIALVSCTGDFPICCSSCDKTVSKVRLSHASHRKPGRC